MAMTEQSFKSWHLTRLVVCPRCNRHGVIALQASMPPAQNSTIILQVAGLQEAAGRIARMLCILYLIGILPMSILVTTYLQVFKLTP